MADYWKDVKAIARGIWEMFQDPEHPFDESSSESREGEAWMAASNSNWVETKWQDVLGLSRNVPDLDELGIDPHRKRVYWMPPYPEYTHWWDFVHGEDPEVTVKRLGAAAAMKRDVDDAIEEYDKMRRKRWGVSGLGESVEEILMEAEETVGAISMARDRASCGEWPMPMSPEDYVSWIIDEAELQEEQAATHPEEADERLPYAKALRDISARLQAAGVRLVPMPWRAKRKRWGLSDVEVDTVLEEARQEGAFVVLEQIADYYGVPVPESPEEILGWLIYARDEALKGMGEGWSEYEREEAEARILLIGKFARKLKMLEVIAVAPPWIRERRRWGVEGAEGLEGQMQAILDEAERDIELVSAIEQDIANNGEPPPGNPGEWLSYVERQVRYDQKAAETYKDQDDRARYLHYANRGREYAARIRALGVRPAPFPWAKERLRWRPD